MGRLLVKHKLDSRACVYLPFGAFRCPLAPQLLRDVLVCTNVGR